MISVCNLVLALTIFVSCCAQVQGAAPHDALKRRAVDLERDEPRWKRDLPLNTSEPTGLTPPPSSAPSPNPVSPPTPVDAADPIENTPAGKKARELYDMMLDMGATLENVTSLGAKEPEIVAGIDKVLKFLPQGETLRKEMLSDVDIKNPAISNALGKATQATSDMVAALTEIQKTPNDVILIKKHYDNLENVYRIIFTTSDGLAAEAFKKVDVAEKPVTPEVADKKLNTQDSPAVPVIPEVSEQTANASALPIAPVQPEVTANVTTPATITPAVETPPVAPASDPSAAQSIADQGSITPQ